MIEIKFKKLVPEAQTPVKKYDIDAGFDLFAISKEETPDFIEYHTGIAIEIPKGYVGLVFPRSSVTKYDLMLKNSTGIIDASYRGEIVCRFQITKEDNKIKTFNVGERVAQIVIIKLPKVILIEAEELSVTERGSQGFGSTGK